MYNRRENTNSGTFVFTVNRYRTITPLYLLIMYQA
jgi:hypothetical protein